MALGKTRGSLCGKTIVLDRCRTIAGHLVEMRADGR